MKTLQTGFTLIELVVVILILSILAATALPRFIDMSGEAHTAAVKGAGGGLGAAMALGHAQWVVKQYPGAAAIEGFGDDTMVTNGSGWVVNNGGNAATTTLNCSEIWTGSMQNPPTVSEAATTEYTTVDTPAAAGTTCTYTYNAAAGHSIAYDSSDGKVTITTP